MYYHMLKNARGHQKLKQARNSYLWRLKGSVVQATPQFWSCGIQNCEKMNFCGFKPHNL